MATVYASPDGGIANMDGQSVRTFRLQTAVNRASAGDVVQLLPGRYTQPIVMGNSGGSGSPMILRGQPDFSAVLDGRQDRRNAVDDFDPMDDDFAFIKLQSADWIVVEQLAFENCWPSAVFIRGCKDITIQRCGITGGRFGIYARNRKPLRMTRRLVLDGITWVQDPAHDMWHGRVTWQDVKQQTPTPNDARYFNGALFGSYDIPGPVTIRRSDISHAFNAIRIDAANDRLGRGRNADVRIERNRFSFIRDNAIEPEKVAERLWVLDNWFFNVHAAFSLDGVNGRYWYFVNNRLLNLRKPGLDGQGHRGGKIFKFHTGQPFPKKAFYVLYNSIQTRTAYTKRGQTREWNHANNAIGICRDGPDCDTDRRMIGDQFVWHRSYRFSRDICDHPDFPDTMSNNGFKVDGYNSQPATFRQPKFYPNGDANLGGWDGELALSDGSPGIGRSAEVTIELPDGSPFTIPGGRDVGAQPLGSIRFPPDAEA